MQQRSAIMFRTAGRSSRTRSTGCDPRRWLASAAIAAAAVMVSGLAAGCAVPAEAGPVIQLSSAQIVEPAAGGVTDVYVDIRNNGPADKLIGARVSAGGRMTLRSPVHPGQIGMRTVTSIGIPAKGYLGLDPNGSHLLVTGVGPMKAGTEITLTLVFAHAGTLSVPAMVTNPETGGSSYFLN
jgi:copper(I)-binding protein